MPYLLGWDDALINSLAFSVILHLGTLIALLAYFWRDWARLIPAGLAAARERSFRGDPDRRLAWLIAATMPPAIVVGLLLNDAIESTFRQPALVAAMLVAGSAIMWLADRLGRKTVPIERLSFVGAFGVGCAQALALVPGISRSGVSISAGLAFGLTREAAARFAFLMATPIIAGAGAWETRKLLTGEAGVPLDPVVLVAGFLASTVAGLAAITWLLRYLRGHPLTVFIVYRLVLAVLILVIFLDV
ncbi:MAG: undecaprenyl-diphosphate phosphatase [Chloroflexi bacterium]|nr:undecaprenyl-diphosphate phosphatase [Chloroflexota bacterium]